MPDYTRLSTWETDPSQMSWYDYAIGRTEPPDYRKIPQDHLLGDSLGDESMSESAYATDDEHAWFYKLKELDELEDGGSPQQLPLPSNQTNPTPVEVSTVTRSGNADTYFKYMFADADFDDDVLVKSTAERECLQVEASTDQSALSNVDILRQLATEIELQQTTSNATEHHQQSLDTQNISALPVIFGNSEQFHHEQELIDRYLESSASRFSDESQTSECDQHYNASKIGIDEHFTHTGFSSCELECYSNSTCDEADQVCAPCSVFSLSGDPSDIRPKLKMVSPRYTFGRNLLRGFSSEKPRSIQGHIRSRKPLAYETQNVIGKRHMSEGVLDQADSDTVEDYALTNKRICLRLSTDIYLGHVGLLSPSKTSFADDEESLRTISKDFFQRKALPSPPKGFAGQFDGMIIDQNMCAVFPFQPHQPVPRIEYQETFGAKAHPNGEFTHTHFRPDPFGAMADYNHLNISQHHPLTKCMSFATDMTISSCHPDVVVLRSKEEEILRREAHIECSSARLEGMAVGFWRYLQGSYGLEEYRQANMCICWHSCECNKMCTRYADLRCPCSKDIVVHDDDD